MGFGLVDRFSFIAGDGLFFAVNMLVNTDTGDTYSFQEISSWLTAAGFKDARTLDAPGPSPLVLATKP